MSSVLQAIYRIRSDARSIDDRARGIAIEQSVEMPVSAIDDEAVLAEIVGRVLAIDDLGHGVFEVRIALATETVGNDAGQLINMLFGNSSIHDDVTLHDVEFPRALVQAFGGPRHGLTELRRRVGASERALTCSALKPQGVPAAKLGDLARRFAAGGIDYIKDDHGLADQAYSPFAARIEAIAAALRGGGTAHYVPSLSGDLDSMRRQIAVARSVGIDTVMVAPMIAGFSNVQRLVRENPVIRLHGPSDHGRRRAHRSAPAHRQALPFVGRRRGDLSQSWRPFRLFAGNLPAPGPDRLAGLGWPAGERSGAGGRNDTRARTRNA